MSGPLRVLHLDSEMTWRGGERQVLELMRRHRAVGDDPHLAAPARSALADRAAAEGFPVHAVSMRGTWDLASAIAIARLHRRVAPHVVHWHAARAHALGAVASTLAPGPVRVLSRRVDFLVRRTPGSRLLYALPIEAIVAISKGVERALVQSGIEARRIRIIPSGIDIAPYEAPFDRAGLRARYGLAPEEVLVLQVAALAPHKSQTDLLKAASLAGPRCPELKIWIAGEGPLRRVLEEEHRRLGLDRVVRFLGFRDDVPDLLRAADVFCLSSYLEGLGTSILEAMAVGLPVVATAVGGIPEAVVHGETGLLVPPRSPEALAGALVELARDPGRREALGRRGRERVQAFTAERTAGLTRSLYLNILGANADLQGSKQGGHRARLTL
jgi:glycosyltransferase involved in cell wall biosynthesis